MSLESTAVTDYPSYDLAIVGGGIVGTTLACALQATNLKIILIEAQTLDQSLQKPQAYAISLLSSQILVELGIWEKISAKIGSFNQIKLSDADHPGIVPFSTQDLHRPHLGYVAEHKVILAALNHQLSNSSNCQHLRPAQVLTIDHQPGHALLHLQHQGTLLTIAARLVVGADGAKSHTRSLAGIKTKGWKYWQSCVAFTIQHQAPQNDIAFERFWSSGPMGVLPLPGNRCQIVWTLPHAEAQRIANLDEPDFLAQLQPRLGDSLGTVQLVSPRRTFPVQLMQSDRYIQSRLALVGDAAHCCHPVGGQGLNLGIRDAAALAQVIEQAHQQNQDIGSLDTLSAYERWRKPENLLILVFTDFLDRFFSNQVMVVVTLRRFGLECLRRIPPLKLLALRLMTGLLGRQPRLAQRS